MEGSEGIQAELAWMAVWNRSLVGKEGESDDGDSAGILCAFSTGTSSSCSSSADRELISRRVGLAQGLVDFTRCVRRVDSPRHLAMQPCSCLHFVLSVLYIPSGPSPQPVRYGQSSLQTSNSSSFSRKKGGGLAQSASSHGLCNHTRF